MKQATRWLIIFLGLAVFALCVYIASIGDLSRNVARFLVVYGVVFGLYCISIFLLIRADEKSAWLVTYLFVIAVLCRIALIGAKPSLSNDIYRYVWEGRVSAAGFNPFTHPPSSPDLDFLRDENYIEINHKELTTIYPPLAQGFFYLGVLIHPGLITQKLTFMLFDVATMALVLALLAVKGVNRNLFGIYGWNPLVIVEFSHSGHLDSLGIFFMMLGILLFHARKKIFGMIGLGASFLAKYLSLLLMPFFLFKKRNAPLIGVFAAVVFIGYLPFAGASGKLLSSLALYGRHWEFNSAVFEILGRLTTRLDAGRWVVFFILAVFSFYEGYKRQDLAKYAFRVVGCALLLSPTLYPWYVCWIVPLLCFFRSPAWILLSGAVALSYCVWIPFRATGAWELDPAILVFEYAPFYTVLAYEGYRSMRRRI